MPRGTSRREARDPRGDGQVSMLPWKPGLRQTTGVIWRKRRLRLAEAGSYQRAIAQATEPLSDTLITALKIGLRPIMDIVSPTLPVTARDLAAIERRNALLRALEILREGKPWAYKAALAELDEQTRTSWQERLAPEPKRKRGGKYPAEASELFKADATSLKVSSLSQAGGR